MALGGALPNMRVLYTAPPGRKLVGADWSQIELWVRGAVTGDEVLLEHMKLDVYRANAYDWFDLATTSLQKAEAANRMTRSVLTWIEKGRPAVEGLKKKDFKELFYPERQACKTGHLATQYGASFKPVFRAFLEEDRKFPFKLAKALYGKFPLTYPRTVQWWEEEMARVQKNGYSETRILGRRVVYPVLPERAKVVNFPIQGTASDVANIVMVDLDEDLEKLNKRERPLQYWALSEVEKPVGLNIQVHDFFAVEAEDYLTEEVERLMVKHMAEREFIIEGKAWKFPIEVQVGQWWSEV